MKLTKEQIQQIDDYIFSCGIKWVDVRAELVDHFATSLENKLDETTKLDFKQMIVNEHKSFSDVGFKKLLENGALLTLPMNYNITPLAYAKQFRHQEIVSLLEQRIKEEVLETNYNDLQQTFSKNALGESKTKYQELMQKHPDLSKAKLDLIKKIEEFMTKYEKMFSYKTVNNDPLYWQLSSTCGASEYVTTHGTEQKPMDDNVYRIDGDYDKGIDIRQDIDITGDAGDVFTVGGWVQGNSIALTDSE